MRIISYGYQLGRRMTNETDNSTMGVGADGRGAGLTGAMVLLFGSDRRVADHDGRCGQRMWLWLPVVSLGWGAILACIWAAAAHLYPWWHESRLPLMPVAAVLAAMGLGPLRAMLTAPAALLERENPHAAATVTGVVIAVMALALLGLVPVYRESTYLPAWLAWLRPPEEYRVLLLMPLWGAWAMMTPVHFCRPPEDGAEPLVAAFGRRQPVAATSLWMAAALGGSLWLLSFLEYGWVALPAVAAMVAGSLGSVAVCRFSGGLSRRGLLGANLLTQMSFLLGYLAGKTHLIS